MSSNVSEKIEDKYSIGAIQKHKFTGCWAQEMAGPIPNVG